MRVREEEDTWILLKTFSGDVFRVQYTLVLWQGDVGEFTDPAQELEGLANYSGGLGDVRLNLNCG